LPFYDRALKSGPNSDALSYKGVALINLQRYEEAREVIEALLRLEPTNIDALFLKGEILYSLGHEGSTIMVRKDLGNGSSSQGYY
jgi:tetratricopeptide (TPR) repeat protein